MTKKRHDVSVFTVGEEINPEDHKLRLRITAIHPKSDVIEAVVIKAEGYFSEDHLSKADIKAGWPQTGFKLNMEIIFRPSGTGDWNPEDKAGVAKNLPWFALTIYKGEKRFAHYC